MDDSVGIHDNYRPKHKFKIGSSYQDISKRSTEGNEAFQDDNSLQYAIMFKNNEPVGILQVRNYFIKHINICIHIYLK